MKFTINWLKEHLDTKIDDQKIIDKFKVSIMPINYLWKQNNYYFDVAKFLTYPFQEILSTYHDHKDSRQLDYFRKQFLHG